MKLQDIRLIVGLGNPGKEYEKTYHNAGFLFIEYIINKNPAKIKNQKSKIKNFEFIKTDGLIFIKSLTFMNESGIAVKEVMKYFKVNLEEILIVHDDSDIELGNYKLSFGRGSAGHNGVESIIRALKTKNFWRLRIGIGKVSSIKFQVSKEKAGLPAEAYRAKAGDFVLKKISKKDLEILNQIFTKSAQKLPIKNS
ncbi:MAG: aminoacyl-tRNA hydrolase [Patescibacteria group bacterium]